MSNNHKFAQSNGGDYCLFNHTGNVHVVHVLALGGSHYENTPIQYTAIFKNCKNDNFRRFFYIFLVFAQNIDCGYTLEPPR